MSKTVIAISCDNNFLPIAAVTARRVAELSTGTPVPIFILGDRLDSPNLEQAKEFIGGRVSIFQIGDELDEAGLTGFGRFTRAAMGRLMLDKMDALGDFDLCLSIDADVLPLADLTKITRIPHKTSPLAACHDLRNTANGDFHKRLGIASGSPYFNSGVLWLDLAWTKQSGGLETARQFLATNPNACKLPDQDALNHAFQNHWQLLDWRWNVQADLLASRLVSEGPYVIHFNGVKPWKRPNQFIPLEYSEKYLALLAASPWCEKYKVRYGMFDKLGWMMSTYGREARDSFLSYFYPLIRSSGAGRFVRRRQLSTIASSVTQRISNDAAEFGNAATLADLLDF